MRPARRLIGAHRSLLSASTSTPTSTSPTPITSVLIANRGEIALRINRTAARLGIDATTIHTDLDARSQHASCAARSLALGQASAYLDGERIVALARRHRIQALHPGYGFLSENAAFAQSCEDAGVVFVGPPASAMHAMGDKARSKEIMTAAGVPCVPGYHGAEQQEGQLLERAKQVGFPVLLKSTKGGGGKGMRIVRTEDEFSAQLRSARSEAAASFGPGGEVMLVERYIQRPRHVEVQVFSDKHGGCVALGERDCSVQRRHQKILEESPAPGLSEELRLDLWDKARRAALAVGYVGAGTVEFILDRDSGEFFFMEMNTRLQVEHPVSEMVTGTDLVEWQFRIAAGERLPLTQDEIARRIVERGAAIEARIYAENPDRGFMPDSGRLVHLRTPSVTTTTTTVGDDAEVRIDAGFIEGDVVSEAYDGMLAKLIVRAHDRPTAIRRMELALREYEVVGLSTNVEFLKRVCRSGAFIDGDVDTGFIDRWRGELFEDKRGSEVGGDVLVQAALAVVGAGQKSGGIGFVGDVEESRAVRLRILARSEVEEDEDVEVLLQRSGSGADTYTATITRKGQDPEVISSFTTTSSSSSFVSSIEKTDLTTHFPTHRSSSTIIIQPSSPLLATSDTRITVFQHGSGIRADLALAQPKWVAEVLGSSREAAASVVAPMPCKILRNEVGEGEEVDKGDALVLIESMKMETVIRSPQKGRVKKLAHKEGDICKAGTVLVIFEDEGVDKDE